MDNTEVFLNWFAVGWSVAAVLVFVLTWFYMPNKFADKVMEIHMKRRKEKKEKENTRAGKRLAQLRIQEQRIVDKVHKAKICMLEECGSRMSYSSLLKATNGFSDDNVIGSGKLATLYKAAMGNGNFLAVKRFQHFPQIEQKFMCEIMTNGRLRHRNLVSLLGFCKEKEEKLLVYNYTANGSLYDWLHPMEVVGCKRPTLNWPLRYVITVGIARGLAWLHHSCNRRITHGNICSKFIFLDRNFDPKISSFGGTMIAGSNSGNLRLRIWESEFKGLDDVYAFGILLVEMVTGKKAEDVTNLCAGSDGSHETLTRVNLWNAIDSSLNGKGFDSWISQFLEVALDCIGLSLTERPTMLEVYKNLCSIGAKKGSAYTSEMPLRIGGGGGVHMAEHSAIDIIEEVE